MDLETLIMKKDEGIVTITLNRPDRLNAMNDKLMSELGTALDLVLHNDEANVLVITGAGRAFCAGADVSERLGNVPGEASFEQRRLAMKRGPQAIIKKIQGMEKPTIAMVNGAAAGAGFDLALACDIRVGANTAKFKIAYTPLGLVPGAGGFWFLPRIVGVGKALEIIYSNEPIEAEEAYRLGVLNKVVPVEELEKEVMGLAKKIASNPPIALRLDKQLVYRGLEVGLDMALELASNAQVVCFASEDHKEALAAMLEKRKGKFKGR